MKHLTSVTVAAIFLVSSCAFRASAQRPLGTDISSHQVDHINWTPATNGGVRFGWCKATEGTGFTSSTFVDQMADAAAAKVYMGAYHYARPGLNPNLTGANSADSEAAYFWSVAGPYIKYGGKYLMPMLDWEDVGNGGTTDPTIANGFTTAQMSAWLNEWCTSVSNTAYANGVIINPVVYTGTWYSTPGSTYPGLNSSVTYHPNTISSYPSTPYLQTALPTSSFPWASCNFWQYADTNWTGGDADIYIGTFDSLVRNFVIGGTNAPLYTLAPTNINVAPGASVTFFTKVSGQAPITFNWLFNGAGIPGATSSNLSLVNIKPSQAGKYAILASNAYAITTNTVYLTVLTNAPGSVVSPGSLADWWTCDGTAADLVGGKTGSPFYGVTYAAGNPGRAFHFDGSTSYITTGATSLAVPWTACFWVNRQNAPSTAAAIAGDGNSELKIEQYNATRQVGFTIFGVSDYNFGYSAPQNTWTHLAFVASGTGASAQMQLYANGSLVGTITTNIPCPRAYLGAGFINSAKAGSSLSARTLDYMLGSVDEIMIFSRALSSTEISTLASAGANGVVRAPQITAFQRISSTQSQLSLRGLTGRNFTIYRSSDLSTWSSVASVANPSGTLLYTTPAAINDFQFYRVSQP